MTTPPAAYAGENYLQGMGGVRPAIGTDPSVLAEAARERIDPEPFWYVAGAAGSGATARANREAFDRLQIAPRMLTGASDRDPSPSRRSVPPMATGIGSSCTGPMTSRSA